MNFYERKQEIKKEEEMKKAEAERIAFEKEQDEIRKKPHKIVNGVCYLLTEIELEVIENNTAKNEFDTKKVGAIYSRLKFLKDTDYIAIKNLEKGISDYPEKDIRQKAREEINEINEIETLDELQKFDYIVD